MTTFYVIATPIGNMEDITLRAIRILKEVDLILCEDTRVTKNLLDHYGINTPRESYHTHSKISKVEEILSLISSGKNIALVSDAGTPGISDPGSNLVAKIREVFKTEVSIVSIPGPSALTASISISGVAIHDFTFLGFLPHKKGRETLFKEIAESERPMIFYESTHRIMKALESLKNFSPDKKIIVAKELTKIYEEIIEGSPDEVIRYFLDNPEKIKGEFVVIVC